MIKSKEELIEDAKRIIDLGVQVDKILLIQKAPNEQYLGLEDKIHKDFYTFFLKSHLWTVDKNTFFQMGEQASILTEYTHFDHNTWERQDLRRKKVKCCKIDHTNLFETISSDINRFVKK